MVNITVSIPEELYREIKKYSEVKWSEVVKKASADYIRRLEAVERGVVPSEKLVELLGESNLDLRGMSIEKALEFYEKAGNWSGRGFPLRHRRADKPTKKPKKPAKGFTTILKISVSLLRKGRPTPAIYVLIAAMCLRRDLTLVTGDEHFRHVRPMRKEFKMELAK